MLIISLIFVILSLIFILIYKISFKLLIKSSFCIIKHTINDYVIANFNDKIYKGKYYKIQLSKRILFKYIGLDSLIMGVAYLKNNDLIIEFRFPLYIIPLLITFIMVVINGIYSNKFTALDIIFYIGWFIYFIVQTIRPFIKNNREDYIKDLLSELDLIKSNFI